MEKSKHMHKVILLKKIVLCSVLGSTTEKGLRQTEKPAKIFTDLINGI